MMKIIKYDVGKKTETPIQKQQVTTVSSDGNYNNWFQLVNGVLVCKYPLGSVGEVSAFNVIEND